MAIKLSSPPPGLRALFRRAGRRYNIDPDLLIAQARQESAFNPDAGSGQGARGVMQIMPATAAGELGIDNPDDLYDPSINIDAGARYMRMMLDRYGGDKRKALAAYNTGAHNVDKYGLERVLRSDWNKAKNAGETGDYVRKIMGNYRRTSAMTKEDKEAKERLLKALDKAGGGVRAHYEQMGEQIADARDRKEALSAKISEYRAASSDAPVSEEEALMSELASRIGAAGGESYSNIAAQYAMTQDPNFGQVFRNETQDRINAARQHFASLGTIQRDKMSQRAAVAKSSRQSTAALRNLAETERQLRDRQAQFANSVLSGMMKREGDIDKVGAKAAEDRRTETTKARHKKEAAEKAFGDEKVLIGLRGDEKRRTQAQGNKIDIDKEINTQRKQLTTIASALKSDATKAAKAKVISDALGYSVDNASEEQLNELATEIRKRVAELKKMKELGGGKMIYTLNEWNKLGVLIRAGNAIPGIPGASAPPPSDGAAGDTPELTPLQKIQAAAAAARAAAAKAANKPE